MPTKIGLISDLHATPAPVAEALSIFDQQGVDEVLCAGDIAGYGNNLDQTVDLLVKSNCKSIRGNHEVWYLEKAANERAYQASDYFESLAPTVETHVEGKHLLMVHAQPPDAYVGGIRLLDEDGNLAMDLHEEWAEQLNGFEYDVLVVGHTHQVFAEQLGNTWVINPGSTKFNHSCAILTLPAVQVEWFALSNKPVERTWNWGGQRLGNL